MENEEQILENNKNLNNMEDTTNFNKFCYNKGISKFTEYAILIFCLVWTIIGIKILYTYFIIQDHINSLHPLY